MAQTVQDHLCDSGLARPAVTRLEKQSAGQTVQSAGVALARLVEIKCLSA